MNRNDYFVELKKHSHQQWIRDLLDLLPVAIYECNEFAVLQYYNRRAAELWGREPNCDQTGPRFCGSLRLYRTDGTLLPHAETPMAEVLLTGVPVNNQEVVIERPDGSRVTVLATIAPIKNDKKELVGAVNCFQDLTERKRAEDELRAVNERLQNLSRRLIEIQETERRTISRELHDEIGQAITAVTLNLQNAKRTSDPSQRAAALDEGIETLDRVLRQIRDLSFDLRPSMLDDLGLAAAIRWQVDRQSQRAGFTAEVVADDFGVELPPELEVACYRIVQEALTNVVRHAKAKNVRVELRRTDRELHLLILDNGVGFDPQSTLGRGTNLGLIGMEERASSLGGQFEIDSAPNHGTAVRVRFPIPSP